MRHFCLLAALAVVCGSGRSDAAFIIGNLGGTYFSGYDLTTTGGTNRSVAEGFTMTSTYTLTSATLRLNVTSATLALQLYADGGMKPGALLGTFTNPADLTPAAGEKSYTFAAPAGVTLLAGQTYWLDLFSTATNVNQSDRWLLSSTFPSGPGATDVGQERSLSSNPPSGTPEHATPTAYRLDGEPGLATAATPAPAGLVIALVGVGPLALLRLARRRAG